MRRKRPAAAVPAIMEVRTEDLDDDAEVRRAVTIGVTIVVGLPSISLTKEEVKVERTKPLEGDVGRVGDGDDEDDEGGEVVVYGEGEEGVVTVVAVEGVGVSEEVKKAVADDGVVSLWDVADLAPEETGLDEAGEEEDAESEEAVVDK
jgi:hypothetical protein